ncbi:hypothetical protein L6R52_16095 [Myxococcota bacterium]|nr:hypothetical protein [Myxococcota bacterium]
MKTPELTRFHTLALGLSAVLAMHCGTEDSVDDAIEEMPQFEGEFAESSQGLLVSCTGLPCGSICHWGARLGFCNKWSQCVPQGTPLYCAPSGDGGFVGGDGGFVGGDGGFVGGDGGSAPDATPPDASPFFDGGAVPDASFFDGGPIGFDGGGGRFDAGLRDGGFVGGDGGFVGRDGGFVGGDGGFVGGDGGSSSPDGGLGADGGLGGFDGSIFFPDSGLSDGGRRSDGSF